MALDQKNKKSVKIIFKNMGIETLIVFIGQYLNYDKRFTKFDQLLLSRFFRPLQ